MSARPRSAPRRRLAALGTLGLGLALLPLGAVASTPDAAPALAAATPRGPNPWVSDVASASGLSYPGWQREIERRGRARLASPQYAAARVAAGLTAKPAVTTTFADLPAVIGAFGPGAGQNPRLHVTDLPAAGGSLGGPQFAALLPGTTLAAAITGAGSVVTGTHDGPGDQGPKEGTNLSGLYPRTSPVLGKGDTSLTAIYRRGAGAAGTVLDLSGTDAASTLDLEAYAPGVPQQTIVLDVDGATLDARPFGGTASATLSPLADFLPAWGIKPGQQKALVAKLKAAVVAQLNVRHPGQVRVVVSGASDPFGRANVSRVVIGGTRAQSGLDAVAGSAAVDPGNLVHEETSLVLLDALSAPAAQGVGADDPSLLAYLGEGSDRVSFVARALANLALQQIGHQAGLLHTDDTNGNRGIMDAGGHKPEHNLYPVGADRLGGTADDPVAKDQSLFGADSFHPLEGLISSDIFREQPIEVLDLAFAPPVG